MIVVILSNCYWDPTKQIFTSVLVRNIDETTLEASAVSKYDEEQYLLPMENKAPGIIFFILSW